MSNNHIRIGITPGDPNGIGFEVLLKTLSNNKILELFTPIIYASPKVFSYYKKMLGMEGSVHHHLIQHAGEAKYNTINLISTESRESEEEFRVVPGTASEEAGRFAVNSLFAATDDLRKGQLDCIVTGPIDKFTVNSEEFDFVGHTEYFAQNFAMVQDKSLMILAGEGCIVAPVTNHIPLALVPKTITTELIIEKCLMLDMSLKRDFGIEKPTIGVLGLNPHAGDNGLLGSEELEIIEPAIKILFEKHDVYAFGPFSPDGYWGNHIDEKFSATLCMYHDQGLIPFKLKNMRFGVNFTAGLKVVRTSPDHGTGYDIAGSGVADESSFRNAIYAAIDIFRNRLIFDEANKNPLRKTFYDRSKDVNVDELPQEDEQNEN